MSVFFQLKCVWCSIFLDGNVRPTKLVKAGVSSLRIRWLKHEILCRESRPYADELYWLWRCPDVSTVLYTLHNTVILLHLTTLKIKRKQLLLGNFLSVISWLFQFYFKLHITTSTNTKSGYFCNKRGSKSLGDIHLHVHCPIMDRSNSKKN